MLFACVLFLALFHVRKKLSFLPLGSATFWLQLHIYLGVVAIALFASHVGWRLPNGIFETCLFGLFTTTSLSGLFGLYLSKTVPVRLSKLREEVLHERIPQFRARVRQDAHAVVVQLVTEVPSDTIADFYTSRLTPYFVRPRNVLYYLRPSSKLRNQLRHELATLQRYCSDAELVASEKLSRLIDQRDDLDYHAALQGAVKQWLFVHIGLTYMLITLATLHGIMAHAFRGGTL